MENKCIVILRNSSKDFATQLSIYEIIELCVENNLQFIACHIEELEYVKLKNDIDMIGCVCEEHLSGRETSYNHYRYMAAFDIENGIIKFVHYNENNDAPSYDLDLESGIFKSESSKRPFYKEYDSGKYGAGLKIYTTETIENIILYYNRYPHLECLGGLVEEKSPEKVLKKKRNF